MYLNKYGWPWYIVVPAYGYGQCRANQESVGLLCIMASVWTVPCKPKKNLKKAALAIHYLPFIELWLSATGKKSAKTTYRPENLLLWLLFTYRYFQVHLIAIIVYMSTLDCRIWSRVIKHEVELKLWWNLLPCEQRTYFVMQGLGDSLLATITNSYNLDVRSVVGVQMSDMISFILATIFDVHTNKKSFSTSKRR